MGFYFWNNLFTASSYHVELFSPLRISLRNFSLVKHVLIVLIFLRSVIVYMNIINDSDYDIAVDIRPLLVNRLLLMYDSFCTLFICIIHSRNIQAKLIYNKLRL